MQLRDYQEEAVQSVFDYFQGGGEGNPVIAMPTGTGKSLVIAGFVKRAMQAFPGQRFMVLTHVKELIEQNASKLAAYWPEAPIGVYSAGLRQRDFAMPVIFGGCASVVGKMEIFGHRDMLIIDEAHLLSPKEGTTYQQIIDDLKARNPYLKVLGLTATPFRLGQGYITDDGVFTDICCDMSGGERFIRFIEEGYLAPLVPRPTDIEIDLSNVRMGANGDYSASSLEDATNDELLSKALIRSCELGMQRQSWVVFTAGVKTAEKAAEMLRSFGVEAQAIHSKLPSGERDRRIAAFKRGELRALCTNNMLTTGFDHPPLDMIVMLRATLSPGLWVQMLGRGTRPSPETGKKDCLVLDFARNTPRLGPINYPRIPRKKGKGGGPAPVKICEECGTYNHAAARFCTFCGNEFPIAPKIVEEASNDELIKTNDPVVEWYDVQQVYYYGHESKKTGQPSIRVEYYCNGGAHKFSEYIHIEAQGFAGKKARDWWRRRFPGEFIPETTADALRHITQLRVPHKVKVWINKQYPEILSVEFA